MSNFLATAMIICLGALPLSLSLSAKFLRCGLERLADRAAMYRERLTFGLPPFIRLLSSSLPLWWLCGASPAKEASFAADMLPSSGRLANKLHAVAVPIPGTVIIRCCLLLRDESS